MNDEWLSLNSDDGNTMAILRCSTITGVRFQPLITDQGEQAQARHPITGEVLKIWSITVELGSGGHQLTYSDKQKGIKEHKRICSVVQGNNPETNKRIN